MSKDTTTATRAGISNCPHCDNKLKIRSSRPAAGLARELALVCEGPNGCSAKFAGILELTHQTAPSARPREGLTIRQAPYRHRTVNDNHLPKRDASGPEVPPPPANDTAELDAATG